MVSHRLRPPRIPAPPTGDTVSWIGTSRAGSTAVMTNDNRSGSRALALWEIARNRTD